MESFRQEYFYLEERRRFLPWPLFYFTDEASNSCFSRDSKKIIIKQENIIILINEWYNMTTIDLRLGKDGA
ncbi:hypothetical protein ACX3U0_04540, partial [Aerococcus urinae]